MNPFTEHIEALQQANTEVEFFKFQKAFHNHDRVIILGNGGSNAVASHISQDYMKFCNKKVSVLSDPSMITMLSNDYGYEYAYQKFLEYYVEKGTLVIIMSSGGESNNMINCMNWCEENKVSYGVLTGFDPNNTIKTQSKNALWNYHIWSTEYGVGECVHQIFLHGVI